MENLIKEYKKRQERLNEQIKENQGFLNTILSSIPKGKKRVLTLTSNSDSPYEDTYSIREDGILLVKWRGQMISSHYDDFMKDLSIQKHFFIKRGTYKRWNTNALGEWSNKFQYKYMGEVIHIRELTPRKDPTLGNPFPTYILAVKLNKEPEKKLTPAQEVMIQASKYKVKLNIFLKNGFYPENGQIGKGPVFCNI